MLLLAAGGARKLKNWRIKETEVTGPSKFAGSQKTKAAPLDWNAKSVTFGRLFPQRPDARAQRLLRMRFGVRIARAVVCVWRKQKVPAKLFAVR